MNEYRCVFCGQPGHHSDTCKTLKAMQESEAKMTAHARGRRVLNNYLPDTHDPRDMHFSVHGPKVDTLPDVVNLRDSPFKSAIKDQKDEGSCTANAGCAVVEFAHRKAGMQCPDLSRQFYYRGERAIEHTVRTDAGAEIRDGIKVAAKQGVPPEILWPYDKAHFSEAPPASVYAAALPFKITKYLRLTTEADMLHCLASGFPFTVGINVYAGFESDEVAKTGKVAMPVHGEKLVGGHAIYFCGYDRRKRLWTGVNSWGPDWGDHGHFTLPWEYLLNPKLATDFWMVMA